VVVFHRTWGYRCMGLSMNDHSGPDSTGIHAPLSDSDMQRAVYVTVLLTLLLPPAIGSTLAASLGFYPFPEIYLTFTSYTGAYVVLVIALILALTPRIVRFVTSLPTQDPEVAHSRAVRAFSHLPWLLLVGIALYTVGGALISDFALESMEIRQYSLRDHLYNQACVLPIALITSTPVFYYFTNRLGRYLGPRGIAISAIPLRTKLATLGIVTPLLIDTVLVSYFVNRTGVFDWQILVLWTFLLAVAAGSTWLAGRSLQQGLSPLHAFLDSGQTDIGDRARSNLTPLTLDELGALTFRYSDLLSSHEKLSGILERSQSLTESIFNNSSALIVLLDRDGRFVRFNPACEALSGFSSAEVVGKYPWDTVLIPEDADRVRREKSDSLLRNPRADIEKYTNRWQARDGSRYVVEWNRSPIFDDNGQLSHVVDVGTDVTARHQIETQLYLKDAALESAINGFAIAGLDGRLIYVNPSFLRMWGYPDSKTVSGKHAAEFWMNPDDAGRAIQALNTDGKWNGEILARRLDGSTFMVEVSASLVRNGSNQPSHMLASFADVTERLQTEHSLRENEERLRLALTSANQGLYDLDVQTGEAIVSPEYATMLGYDPAEFHETNAAWRERLHPDDQDKVYQVYTDYISGKRSDYRVEFRQRTKNGGWKWILSLGKLLSRDREGRPLRMLGTHTDITERRHAEDRLHATSQTLSAVVDTTPVMIAYLDLNLNFVRVNKAYAAADNKAPDDFVGKNHFALYPNADNEAIFRRVIETGEAYTVAAKPFEYEHNPERGVSHWDWTLTPIKDGAGNVTGLVLSLLDVTDRINALEAAQRGELELKRINETLESRVQERTALMQLAQRIAHLGHWSLNLASNAIEWSEETYRIFGYVPDSVTPSQALYEARIHPDDLAMMQNLAREVLAGGHSRSSDYRIVRENGDLRWVHGTAEVNCDPSGKPVLLYGTVHDITDRKLSESALVAAKEAAEQANRAKNDFLSRMSHELRTPMNAILGFAQVLEYDQLPEEQLEYVREIHRAGDHLLELINELLDLSRIESGKLVMVLQSVSVRNLADEATQIIHPLLKEKRIKLTNRCEQTATVMADPVRLKQVLLNLLSNAVKYNRPEGRIMIACQPLPQNRIRISVTDTGPGIDAAQMHNLFRPFERLGAEFTGITGTGIGLAIAKELVELMGGTIGVDSTHGEGSTFWIDLPLAQAGDTVLAPPAAKTAVQSGLVQHTVLYIEDNPANLRVVEAFFRHFPSYRLLTASNGEFGLELARRYRPDAILLDIHLPGMDGYSVLDQLRADSVTRSIPVIALSADAMPLDIERGLKAGFLRYLTKPLRTDELVEALGIALVDRKGAQG